MSKDYLITENSLVSIANEVRNLTGGKEQISISEIIHTLNNLEIAEKTSLPVLNANYPEDSSLTVISGQDKTVNFIVVIDTPGKPAEYTYQWFENGAAIDGANSSTYSKAITTGGTFSYYCEITNEAGTITSRVATLNVTWLKLPVLDTNYPKNVTQIEKSNGSASFAVEISTAGIPDDYTYQWYVNDSAVSGATSASYTKTGLTSAANYTIYCKVTNAAGTVTSRTATLTVQSSQPTYTYSGSHELIKEGTYNWKIKLKTSGKLKFTHLGNCSGIDLFLVGGGGGGGSSYGAGGGGGYTKTVGLISVSTGTEYDIVVGAGGAGNSTGGTTTAFNNSISGGKPGGRGGNGSSPSSGGAGGSGGGGSTNAAQMSSGGNGGSDGSNGKSGYGSGGKGQGTSTREFYTLDQNKSATLYAGGGGGYWMSGGSGGGGGSEGSGTANTGGGGGGGNHNPGSGGSGIVVIRNHR